MFVLKIGFIFLSLALIDINMVESITRLEITKRGSFWIREGVPYSMTAYYPDPNGKEYRTDCSGYVSMSWNLSTSLTTATLPTVSHPIEKQELNTGDILLKQKPSPGTYGHTLIFDKWSNNEQTFYWAYEQHGPTGTPTVYREIPYPYFNDNAYHPYRYLNVQ